MSPKIPLLEPPPLVRGKMDFGKLDDDINRPLETFPTTRWAFAITVTGALATVFLFCFVYTIFTGIGSWGNNNPVGWGWAITNFVFWIGIGHAGTLISAILSSSSAEVAHGHRPLRRGHDGLRGDLRAPVPLDPHGPPLAGLLLASAPAQRQRDLGELPLAPALGRLRRVHLRAGVGDVLVHGIAARPGRGRDRAKNKIRKLAYGLLSLGWQGSNRAWSHYEKAYLLFAGLSTPLVLSVHSVVSFDFAVSVIPGWHTTIFPPYFVAGAIFSGFAMVCTLIVLLRKFFHLEHLVTKDHLDVINRITIATSLMVGYAYLIEFFMAWYSGVLYEKYVFLNRALGPYAWAYWSMVTCNVLVPQLLWIRKIRRTALLMYPVVILVNVGMWFERFVIIVTSLHRDFLPSSWDYFRASWVDVGALRGQHRGSF